MIIADPCEKQSLFMRSVHSSVTTGQGWSTETSTVLSAMVCLTESRYHGHHSGVVLIPFVTPSQADMHGIVDIHDLLLVNTAVFVEHQWFAGLDKPYPIRKCM